MQLSFVITNFNNSFHTGNLVRSVDQALKAHPAEVKLIVVDNASAPQDCGELRALSAEFDWVHVIYNDNNLGYFPGLNVGLDYLADQELAYDLTLVGNNDLLVPEDFLRALEENSQELATHLVSCPSIISAEGQQQNPHVVSGISKFRRVIWRVYYSSFLASKLLLLASQTLGSLSKRRDVQAEIGAQEIAMGYGALYILSPEFLANGNRLFMPTFLMHEEYFLSVQLKKLGQKPYYFPRITVNHVEHATVKHVPRRHMWEFSRASYAKVRSLEKTMRIIS